VSPDDPAPRLGYLLKHAQLRFTGLVRTALAPLGIDTREWATLISLDDERPLSQTELATRVGVDRTTMVALVDALQAKGLVERRPDPDDRRKNAVKLTDEGRDVRQRAEGEVDRTERAFLTALTASDARRLKDALRAVIAPKA
jgi:DNA-binding MarR family transcriptional regulator